MKPDSMCNIPLIIYYLSYIPSSHCSVCGRGIMWWRTPFLTIEFLYTDNRDAPARVFCTKTCYDLAEEAVANGTPFLPLPPVLPPPAAQLPPPEKPPPQPAPPPQPVPPPQPAPPPGPGELPPSPPPWP